MKKLNLLRISKEVEIVGLDISEMGGVSLEVYNKLKRDFNIPSPANSPYASMASRQRPTIKGGAGDE